MLVAANHFPGNGDTSVSFETHLPRTDESLPASTPTPDAAVEFLLAGGDMVMVAHHLSTADATYEAIKAAVLSGRLRQRGWMKRRPS